MAKTDLGTKVTCNHCGARFYDLKKSPPECPSCGSTVKVESKFKTRRASKPPAALKTPTPQEVITASKATSEDKDAKAAAAKGGDAPVAEGDEEEIDEEEEEGLIEDTSDLSQDKDDVSEVLEHVEKSGDDKA